MSVNIVEPPTNSVCMYTPSAEGGMAQYAWEVMHAIAAHPRAAQRYELVSGADLQEQFKSEAYKVQAILPPLRHRSAFSNKVSWIASRLTHYPRREWFFLNWLKSRPDVSAIHFQEWTPWLAAPMFRRIKKMGKKIFYTVHNVVPHHYPALVPRAVFDGWIRKACRLCDGLFVLTEPLAKQLSQFLGEGHPPIHVAPHGVWTVRDLEKRPALSQRLAWKKLLFFGSIRRNKGLDLLLRAAEQLPGYSITIAGEPHEKQYYESEVLPQIQRLRAAGLNIDLRDRFTPDEEIGPLFASHSSVILPYTKGFVAQSGVIFMALAHEVPVVASEAGGLKDLFSEYQIGEIFREHTPEALAKAIRTLHEGDRCDDTLAELRAAKARFSWQAAAGASLAAYALAQDGRREADDCAIATNLAV